MDNTTTFESTDFSPHDRTTVECLRQWVQQRQQAGNKVTILYVNGAFPDPVEEGKMVQSLYYHFLPDSIVRVKNPMGANPKEWVLFGLLYGLGNAMSNAMNKQELGFEVVQKFLHQQSAHHWAHGKPLHKLCGDYLAKPNTSVLMVGYSYGATCLQRFLDECQTPIDPHRHRWLMLGSPSQHPQHPSLHHPLDSMGRSLFQSLKHHSNATYRELFPQSNVATHDSPRPADGDSEQMV